MYYTYLTYLQPATTLNFFSGDLLEFPCAEYVLPLLDLVVYF